MKPDGEDRGEVGNAIEPGNATSSTRLVFDGWCGTARGIERLFVLAAADLIRTEMANHPDLNLNWILEDLCRARSIPCIGTKVWSTVSVGWACTRRPSTEYGRTKYSYEDRALVT